MTIHEYGKKENPVLLLLPGTVCHWKGNYDGVVDKLAEDFLVCADLETGTEKAWDSDADLDRWRGYRRRDCRTCVLMHFSIKSFNVEALTQPSQAGKREKGFRQ